jgi:hypothetical protein
MAVLQVDYDDLLKAQLGQTIGLVHRARGGPPL